MGDICDGQHGSQFGNVLYTDLQHANSLKSRQWKDKPQVISPYIPPPTAIFLTFACDHTALQDHHSRLTKPIIYYKRLRHQRKQFESTNS
jgi:hypothetical protein